MIGYELFNEPNFTTNLLSLIPGLTDRWYMGPMYDQLSKAILAIIPDTLIFFEPTTWSDNYPVLFQFGPFKLKDPLFKAGLDHAPNHQPEQGVFAFHYYSWINHIAKGRTLKDYFDSRQEDWKKMKVAPIVTEFGFGNSQSNKEMLGWFDQYLVSWTAYEYKSFVPEQNETDFVPTCTGCGGGLLINNDPATPNWPIAKDYSRPFVTASAGHLLAMKVDPDTSELKFSFEMDSSIDAPTVVYCNRKLGGGVEAWYPDGVEVEILPAGSATWWWTESNPNYVEIRSALGRDAAVRTVSVTVSKKSKDVGTQAIE